MATAADIVMSVLPEVESSSNVRQAALHLIAAQAKNNNDPTTSYQGGIVETLITLSNADRRLIISNTRLSGNIIIQSGNVNARGSCILLDDEIVPALQLFVA